VDDPETCPSQEDTQEEGEEVFHRVTRNIMAEPAPIYRKLSSVIPIDFAYRPSAIIPSVNIASDMFFISFL
jgi:hypothetical protein